jgi:hypothetical protein
MIGVVFIWFYAAKHYFPNFYACRAISLNLFSIWQMFAFRANRIPKATKAGVRGGNNACYRDRSGAKKPGLGRH